VKDKSTGAFFLAVNKKCSSLNQCYTGTGTCGSDGQCNGLTEKSKGSPCTYFKTKKNGNKTFTGSCQEFLKKDKNAKKEKNGAKKLTFGCKPGQGTKNANGVPVVKPLAPQARPKNNPFAPRG